MHVRLIALVQILLWRQNPEIVLPVQELTISARFNFPDNFSSVW